MTTAQTIVQQAYREGNLIPVGTDPTTTELAEGLARLNALVFYTLGGGIGEVVYDWLIPQPQRTAPLAADFPQRAGTINVDQDSSTYLYPPKNSRIVWNGVTVTAFFPEAPSDGSRMALTQGSGLWDGNVATPQTVLTLNGNGRLIEGSTTKVVTNNITGPTTQWWYRADLATWVKLSTLALTDSLPFAEEIDDLWILTLAFRLAGRYGKQMSLESVSALKEIRKIVAQNYTQAQNTQYNADDIPPSFQSYASDLRGGF